MVTILLDYNHKGIQRVQILIHCVFWNLMVEFNLLWGKSALLRPYSVSCCQQGRKIFTIIPIRLLKSDYVGCLQIKNSPSHLWYLERQRFTNMISPGEFIWLPSWIFSGSSIYVFILVLTKPLRPFFKSLCLFVQMEGEEFLANEAEIYGTFLFCFFAVQIFSLLRNSSSVSFICYLNLDMLINWGQRLGKLVMMLHVWK